MEILSVGIAGFFGAISRYLINLAEPSIHSQNFPYGTLLINLSGCFIAGLSLGLATKLNPELKQYLSLIIIGFIGSYTTFSTFGVDTLSLIDSNSLMKAMLNIATNVIGGVLMVWFGRILA
jgi:CrcB protein